MPKITIITVCYNAISTIENTIKSVLSQTYDNLEYIIIDGGSTDGTIDVIKKYEKKFSYWKSEPDKGIYDAMNKGIKLATGEWINFMNAGDSFYNTEVLQSLSTYFNDNQSDIIYGDTCIAINNKNKYRVVPENISNIEHHLPFCHQSCFVKSSIIKSNTFQLQYKYVADYAMFYKFYKSGYCFKYVHNIISNYEISEGLTASNMYKCYLETFTVNKRKPTISKWRIKARSILITILPSKLINKIRVNGYNKNPRFFKI